MCCNYPWVSCQVPVRTGSNNTDSHWGLSCFTLVIILIRNRLRVSGVVSEAAVFFFFFLFFLASILKGNGRKVCRKIYEFSCSAKWGIHIPQLNWWFMHDILEITNSGLSCCLIFNMKVMSINISIWTIPYLTLYFKSHLSVFFIFKVNSVPYLKVRCRTTK